MNAKQRMRVAMSGGQPDRVPTMPQIWLDHAALVAGVDLVDLLRAPAMTFDVLLALWRRYRMDATRVWQMGKPRHIVERDGVYVELHPKTGVAIGRVDLEGGGSTIPFVQDPPIKSAADVDRMEVLQPEDYADSIIAPVGRFVRAVGDDLFVAAAAGGFTMNALLQQRGPHLFLTDLVDNPALVFRIHERATEIAINRAIAFVRAGVDALYIGDASASASLISPAHFRQFCVPFYQEFTRALRPYGVLSYLHVCGKANPILDLMADSGVDCIEPLDPLGGVDVGEAKRRVGHRVALMGGVNTLTLLNGTPADVAAEAKACIQKGAPGGGYILAAGDMVPRHTPLANMDALIQAAVDYGTYPLAL